jgi:hypothetical protein
VTNPSRKFNFEKLSTIRTITTTTESGKKKLKRILNVQKWLKNCWKWIISTWKDNVDGFLEKIDRCRSRAKQGVSWIAAWTWTWIDDQKACQYMDQQIRFLFYKMSSIITLNKRIQVRINTNVAIGYNSSTNVLRSEKIFERECGTRLQTNERKVKRRMTLGTSAVSDCDCKNKSEVKPPNKAEKTEQNNYGDDKNVQPVNSTQKVTISVATMISLTIYLMLIQQSVEINPGPHKARQTMKIITFNTNGLGDKMKLKRLLKKLEPVIN